MCYVLSNKNTLYFLERNRISNSFKILYLFINFKGALNVS